MRRPTLDRAVSVEGEGDRAAIVVPGDDEPAFRVVADGSGLTGLTLMAGHHCAVDGEVSREARWHRSVLALSADATVMDMVVTDGACAGIVLPDPASPTITGNQVDGNAREAIVVSDLAFPTITGNEVGSNAGSGIEVWDPAAPTITGNEVHENDLGDIVVSDSASASNRPEGVDRPLRGADWPRRWPASRSRPGSDPGVASAPTRRSPTHAREGPAEEFAHLSLACRFACPQRATSHWTVEWPAATIERSSVRCHVGTADPSGPGRGVTMSRHMVVPIAGLPRLVLLGATLIALTATWVGTLPVSAETPVMRAGGLAGPLGVRGGSRLGTVARLPLGAGRWSVVAKGVLRNTTGATTPRPVRCRLVLAGSGDQVLASPRRRDVAGSRQAFLLTHAARLVDPGDATLRCAAPGSATGAVVAQDIRMVAFRLAALGVREEGHLGIFIGDPEAHSQVRLLIGDGGEVGGAMTTVATEQLPPGKWAITAKATARQGASDGSAMVRCAVVAGADYGVTYGKIARAGLAGDRLPIALQAVQSSASPIDVRLECQDLTDGDALRIGDVRLSAYRAMALADEPLDPDAEFSAFPSWMRPLLFAGQDVQQRDVPGDGSYHSVNRMRLPAADWVVVAHGVAYTLAGTPTVDCRVGRRGSHDRVTVRLTDLSRPGDAGPFVIVWTGGFAEARNVVFQCRSSGSGVRVGFLAMVAYQAGTLVTVPLR